MAKNRTGVSTDPTRSRRVGHVSYVVVKVHRVKLLYRSWSFYMSFHSPNVAAAIRLGCSALSGIYSVFAQYGDYSLFLTRQYGLSSISDAPITSVMR